MNRYTTIVQLKNADNADYERLDREMAKASFIKVALKEEQGREYNYRGVTTLQKMVELAYNAARKTGKQYALTVM